MDRRELIDICTQYRHAQEALRSKEVEEATKNRQLLSKKIKGLREQILAAMNHLEMSRIDMGGVYLDRVVKKRKPAMKREVSEILDLVSSILSLNAETTEALKNAVENALIEEHGDTTEPIESLVIRKPKTSRTTITVTPLEIPNATMERPDTDSELLDEMYT